MSASVWLPVLAVAWAACAAAVGVAGVAALLAWRYGRRRWRALRSHWVVGGVTALMGWAGVARLRIRAPGAPAAAGGWSPHRLRRDLAHSVEQAEVAVGTARDLGGSTASLEMLCRRLHRSAEEIAAVLRVVPGDVVPDEVARPALELMAAASEVRAAAVISAGDTTGSAVRAVARDVHDEVECLTAGLASARSISP